MQVLVNADDFGLCDSANRAIAMAFSQDWIQRTTLMVNMPDAERAVEAARRHGFADRVGLHLNLVEGRPMTAKMSFSGLLARTRMFLPYGRREADAIRGECRAQVEKYLSFGLPLMHCDSHCHMHTRLPIAAILLPLLQEYGFKSVRRPYNLGGGGGIGRGLRMVRNAMFDSQRKSAHLASTDFFGVPNGPLPVSGAVELMVHPRYDGDGQIVDVSDCAAGTGRPLETVISQLRKRL